jgi:replicative DNA helicase
MQSTNKTSTYKQKPRLQDLKDEVSFYLKKFKNSVELLERYKEPSQKIKIKIQENNLFINVVEKLLRAYEDEIKKRDDLGKIPPQAIDLEEAILGALMLENNDQTEKVLLIMNPDSFYNPAHQEIFSTLQKMKAENMAIDMRTVVMALRKSGKLEMIGGAHYIAELTSKVSSAANLEYHARCVIEMAIKRKLIEYGSKIHQDCYDDTVDVFVQLDKCKKELKEIEELNVR